MVAALHVVAINLYKNILKPCSIPSSTAASQELREVLGRLFREDPRKEAVTRALLSFTYANADVDGEIKQTVEATSSDILKLLHPFLGDNRESFHTDLDKLLHDAAHLWKLAQRSRKKIDASIDDRGFDKCNWDYLDEFGDVPLEATENPSVAYGFEMLGLFPCIYVPENEDDPVLLAGYALWPEQTVVAAAEHEHKECMTERRRQSGRGSIGTGLSTKRRRASTVVNGSPRAMASSPASPNTRRISFLDSAIQEATQKVEAPNGSRGEG